jgi:hypothetical protein
LGAAALPGYLGGFKLQHDVVKWCLVKALKAAGIRVSAEVVDVFRRFLPPSELARFRGGVVPDIVAYLPAPTSTLETVYQRPLAQHLGEVKTLHFSPTMGYLPGGQIRAVDQRAARADKEYLDKLRRIDGTTGRMVGGAPGPLEKFASGLFYHTLVFGWVGEASSGVAAFLKIVAAQGAPAHGREVGALHEMAAKASLERRLRRVVSMAAWRARAEHLLQRAKWAVPPLSRALVVQAAEVY